MNEQTHPETADIVEAAADGTLDSHRVEQLERVLESLLLSSDQPMSLEQLHRVLGAELGVGKKDLRTALARLDDTLSGRAVELREVASGYRIQVRPDYAEWVSKLWQEKPPRLSRALLETLALICYRQPVTRGEIEEVRGVALSPNIIRTLLERGWIREVGVKEVPGRPSLFGTTAQLLDDLSLRSLDDLPSLPEIKDPEQLEAALQRLGEQLHEVSHIGEADVAAPPGPDADQEADDTDAVATALQGDNEAAADTAVTDAQAHAEPLDGDVAEAGADSIGADVDANVDVGDPSPAADDAAPEPAEGEGAADLVAEDLGRDDGGTVGETGAGPDAEADPDDDDDRPSSSV